MNRKINLVIAFTALEDEGRIIAHMRTILRIDTETIK